MVPIKQCNPKPRMQEWVTLNNFTLLLIIGNLTTAVALQGTSPNVLEDKLHVVLAKSHHLWNSVREDHAAGSKLPCHDPNETRSRAELPWCSAIVVIKEVERDEATITSG